MKIRIFGGPGSGKTTLAKIISEKYNFKHVDLDDLKFASKEHYNKSRPYEERTKILNKKLENKNWVIEGVSSKDWSDSTFREADEVVILKINNCTEKYRLIKRFIKRKLKLEKARNETLQNFIDMLKWTKIFRNQNMPQTIKMLNKEKISFRMFKNYENAAEYLEEKIKEKIIK